MTKPARKPKFYTPDEGDELIQLADIRPEHRDRVFEARDQDTGEGIVGKLRDAERYLFHDVVMIRFDGEQRGIAGNPDTWILLKSETFDLDAFRERMRADAD